MITGLLQLLPSAYLPLSLSFGHSAAAPTQSQPQVTLITLDSEILAAMCSPALVHLHCLLVPTAEVCPVWPLGWAGTGLCYALHLRGYFCSPRVTVYQNDGCVALHGDQNNHCTWAVCYKRKPEVTSLQAFCFIFFDFWAFFFALLCFHSKYQ